MGFSENGREQISFRPFSFVMQFDLNLLKECWFLCGPTACGKSDIGVALAAALAEQRGVPVFEIVALDSMSLYRGMDIGTAKPPAEMQQKVPHHLIDVIEPYEEYSLAQYVEAAETVCRGIFERGRTPLFVGGTGLYLRGIIRGVFDGPSADWEYRKRLQDEAASHEAEYLHQLLQEVDPAAAAVLHPNDERRLVRALEVHHVTGRPLSEQQQQGPLPIEQRAQHVYWLSPPREWLYDRINRRVDAMMAAGLVDEVRRLLQADRPLSRTARQALGYKEIIEHLDEAVALDEAMEQIKTRTRQFAKRQYTWFRNLEECRSIEMSGREDSEELAQRILGV